MSFFANKLFMAAAEHDYDKLTSIDWFHADFITGFEKTGWWDNHRKIHRHHLAQEDGIPDDVNLVDLIEYISDCVMAGMARSGEVYEIKADVELLEKAFKNTVELLKKNVEIEMIVDEKTPPPNSIMGGGVDFWERSNDPFHSDAMPDGLKHAGTSGDRKQGWMAIDFVGNEIGFIPDGTVFKKRN